MRNWIIAAIIIVLLVGFVYHYRGASLFTANTHNEQEDIADNKPDLYERNRQRLNWQSQQNSSRYYYGNQGNYSNYQYGGQGGNQIYYYYNNSSYGQGGGPRIPQSPPPN